MQEKKRILKVLLGIVFVLSLFMALSEKTQAAINYVPLSLNNSWVSGTISKEDEVDYYSVRLDKSGWLTVDYQGLSVKDSYIEIYNYDLTKRYCRTEIYYSSDISPKNHTDVLAMEPGTYMIKIFAYGRNIGGYRVRTSFKPANNNESLNNNSFSTAQKLNINQTVNGFISEDDEIDFYKIELNSTKTIRFVYTSYISDSYLQVWNKDYIEVSKRNIYNASEESPLTYVYEETLSEGTYYIKIYPYGSNTGRYTLKYEEKVLAKSISVSGNKVVTAGKSFNLKAKVSPSNATDKTVEWKSGDTWIADVDRETGKVTTHRAGKVNITVSAQDGSNTTKVISIIVAPGKISAPSGYKKSKGKAYIYWNSESGVSGYQIQYSKNKSFKGAKTKKVSKKSTSKIISKLSRAKYYFRVRGYVKVGKKYYYGTWSKKKVINMKK